MTYARDRLKEKMEKNSCRVRCVITAGCQQGSSDFKTWTIRIKTTYLFKIKT